jgi:hypothetical protein
MILNQTVISTEYLSFRVRISTGFGIFANTFTLFIYNYYRVRQPPTNATYFVPSFNLSDPPECRLHIFADNRM